VNDQVELIAFRALLQGHVVELAVLNSEPMALKVTIIAGWWA
jgi:hypothetical protein